MPSLDANFANVTWNVSADLLESDTTNVPFEVNSIITIRHQQHGLSLHSSPQRVGDNGREKKTKSSEQRQHLAGLLRGD